MFPMYLRSVGLGRRLAFAVDPRERGPSPAARAAAPKKTPPTIGGVFWREVGGYLRTTPSPLTSTSTRRFGARHATSALKLVIVQTTPGTGCVLPMPSVSILSRGT